MVMLRLLYFARLREQFGMSAEEVNLPVSVQDVKGLTDWLRARGGAWESELASGRPVRVAVNQDMASPEQSIHPGDEIAFFPPVTGG